MALLPHHYLNAVVALEKQNKQKYQCVGTGFLVGFDVGKKGPDGRPLYKIFLVTNRHCFEGQRAITLRFNVTGGRFKRYNLELIDENDAPTWLRHKDPNVDIAVVGVPVTRLRGDSIEFDFISEELIAFQANMDELGICLGDAVFVLGFPMGLAGDERNYAIVRGGTIARLDTETLKKHQFLIDATIFPGNSGGPVILRPTRECLEGQKAVTKAYLIGIVRSYLPYKDRAVSEQTGEPRVVFVENSGLAAVVPMDYVKEAVQPLMAPREEKQTEVRRSIPPVDNEAGTPVRVKQ